MIRSERSALFIKSGVQPMRTSPDGVYLPHICPRSTRSCSIVVLVQSRCNITKFTEPGCSRIEVAAISTQVGTSAQRLRSLLCV